MFRMKNLFDLMTQPSTSIADVIIMTLKDGSAVAIDGNTMEVIVPPSTNHGSVLQRAIDAVENLAKEHGVYMVIKNINGPLRVDRSIHLPCENGGYYHFSGRVSGQNGAWTIIYRGDGPIMENDGAAEYYTSITLENMSVLLFSKRSTGFKLYSLTMGRNLYISYPSWMGEPEVKTWGIAVKNGNAYTIEQAYIEGTHAGVVSMGGEHGLIMGIHFGAQSWTEFGALIPHDVGWAPISVLEEAGYPIVGSSRHHVLIDFHFYGTGKLDLVKTSSGEYSPIAFRVAASLLLFPKIEGDIRCLYQGDWGQSLVIGHYYTGESKYTTFKNAGITILSHLSGGAAVPWPQNVGPGGWTYLLNELAIGPFTVTSFIKGLVTPIVSGVVSVSAGGSYTVAQFAVPSGRQLVIHSISELYDPDNEIYAEVTNVTDGTTVAQVDGFSDSGWIVPEGKTVEFKLVNKDSSNAHSGNYAFLISMI